jgi:hypothetical protein
MAKVAVAVLWMTSGAQLVVLECPSVVPTMARHLHRVFMCAFRLSGREVLADRLLLCVSVLDHLGRFGMLAPNWNWPVTFGQSMRPT